MKKGLLKNRIFQIGLLAVFYWIFLIPIVGSDSADYKKPAEIDFDVYADQRVLAHKITGPWESMIISLDIWPEHKLIAVEVDTYLTEGTDTSCALFGAMMRYLTKDGWIVAITNEGWFPGQTRVIDGNFIKNIDVSY